MAGINRTTGKATDLITFSRASGGTALRKISYGSELVTNGTFDTDTSGWSETRGHGVLSWNSGRAKVVADGAPDVSVAQAINDLTVGSVYYVTGDVDSGTMQVSARLRVSTDSLLSTDNVDGFVFSSGASGSDSFAFVATQTTHYVGLFGASDGAGDTAYLDNISVKEVLFDQPDGTLTLFNHPTNIPRIEYDAAGNVKGLLIEEARTNSAPESNGWAGAGFQSGLSTTLTANYGTSPDGTQNSTRVQFSGGTVATNRIEDIITGTFASLTHTVSCWMRSTDGSNQIARLKCTHGGVSDYFSLDQTVTGDWQRFSFTQAFGAGGTSVVAGVVNGSAGGSADIEVYGLQVELNASFPTSYIPTSGATATRAADIASISVDNFGYNQKAGTVVVEAERFGTNNYPRTVMIDNGSEAESIGLGSWGATNAITGYVVDNGVVQAVMATGNAGTSPFKNALTYKANDFAASRDGGTPVTDSSGSVPLDVTTMRFGRNENRNQHLNGHIKSIDYYPRRLSNSQLQELTT